MKVVICGAGIAGLALANRLAALGHDVVVLERTPGPRPQGYMIDFFGAGYDAVEAMGLLPALREVAYHLEEATLLDERGRRRARIDPKQFATGPLLSIMRPDLERVLREHLPAAVELRFDTSVTAVSDHGDGVRVTAADGSQYEADLVVGADGIHSTVRRLVFGEEPEFLRYLGFHTAAFTFDSPEIHATIGGRFCLTDTAGRQMGFYSLRDGRVAAFTVHRTANPVLPADLRAAVRHSYGGLGWIAPEALDRCPPSPDIYYDQVAQIVMPRWSTGRVVLIGDACHAVSLLAGQGASLGIAGAYVLADQLTRPQPIEQALTSYEELWRPIAEEKQAAGRAGAGWFLPESRLRLALRRLMLRFIALPMVKRRAAAVLTGKSTALISNLADPGQVPADRRA
ncbi:FAD-dependent monooxygenase [Kribbella sancticallisti]|uniref:FAD-dependent monooxygenase n=1 Tax=Kribbella sancticallisti TaxID=460087 RepID=A0ABP4Q957_9ACTN